MPPSAGLVAVFSFVVSTLTFFTGKPELTSGPYDVGRVAPMDQKAYHALVQEFRQMKSFVPITKTPPSLNSAARYGLNFSVGEQNRGWILDGDDTRGWVIYLDLKGNGDLSNARPQAFKRVGGVYQLQGSVRSDGALLPYRFKLARLKDSYGKVHLNVLIFENTVRRGTLKIGGNAVSFLLSGYGGIYNDPSDNFTIVRPGAKEPETYTVLERYINPFGKSYEFQVDRLGKRLSLTELAVERPDRPSLTVGSLAPSFAATDLDGVVRSLATYRGRLLLVEFWGTWCGPCQSEAPRMVKLYRATRRDQLEFLGIDNDSSEKTLRQFLTQFGMKWPQIREPMEGALQRLYRVAGFPTYYLIGRSGEILATWQEAGETADKVSKFLAAR